MNHKIGMPQLRFQQFAGKWCLDQLDAVVDKKISYGIVQAGEHVENGMPYIKSQNLNTDIKLHELQRTSDVIAEKYQRSEVKPGDIVFSLRGNIGISRIVPESIEVANLTQGTARISVSNLFYNRFINFSLQTNFIVKQVSEVSKGSTFQEISLEALRKIKIHIPTLPEQQKIASFLSAVDEKIQQLSRKKELLEQYKKGLMQQLFSGKLRFKDVNGNDYADWEEKKLGDIGIFQTSSIDKLSKENELEVYLVNYMNVYRHEEINNNTIKHFQVVTAKENQINSCDLKRGDILFTPSSETPTDIGHSVVIFEDIENAVYSYHLMRFRPKRKIDILYSHYFCNIPEVLNQLSKLATGSTRFTISVKSFSSIEVKLPCLEEQQKIAKFLSNIDLKIESTSQQITQTQSFKKGLLQQLFV